MRNQVMEEQRDGERKERSWWTAVGLFTSRISLFSRCLAAHRGKGRERRAGVKEREQPKDVSDSTFGSVCQVGLIIVCFMTCTFKVLRGRQPGASSRNALSQDNTGNNLRPRVTLNDPLKSPQKVKKKKS